jgi:phosphate transport system ATP-binding protein
MIKCTTTIEPPVIEVQNLSVYYSDFIALQAVWLNIAARQITAFIGPSGCGKSTLLRTFNRMNDGIPGFRKTGSAVFQGADLYRKGTDPTELRRQIGMVFQKPNPFSMSIYNNIAFGPSIHGYEGDMDELVERSLTQAGLWAEVKNRLKSSALALSGGQQQRLCIARALAVEPEVLLLDEPCSALDPNSTERVEELLLELKENYTLVIVTHNMQQAHRVSDNTAFFSTRKTKRHSRGGYLCEFGTTEQIFTSPREIETQRYVGGHFG